MIYTVIDVTISRIDVISKASNAGIFASYNQHNMKNLLSLIVQNTANLLDSENRKVMENNEDTASHLETAAAHHLEAANYLKTGNYEKAEESAMLAKEHLNLAGQGKRSDMQDNSLNNGIAI